MLSRFNSAERYTELLIQGQGTTAARKAAAMCEFTPRNKTPLLNESRTARARAFRRLPSFAHAFEVRTGIAGVDSTDDLFD